MLERCIDGPVDRHGREAAGMTAGGGGGDESFRIELATISAPARLPSRGFAAPAGRPVVAIIADHACHAGIADLATTRRPGVAGSAIGGQLDSGE